jgi:hypothetical protein
MEVEKSMFFPLPEVLLYFPRSGTEKTQDTIEERENKRIEENLGLAGK